MHAIILHSISSYVSKSCFHHKDWLLHINNLVKKDLDCNKEDWEDCEARFKIFTAEVVPFRPSSHTQKRRLQRMHKKETIEQQIEAVPAKSAIMKKVWRPKQVVSTSTWIEQVMADNYLSPLAQINVWCIVNHRPQTILVRKFAFLASKLYQKNRRHMLTITIGISLTRASRQSDRSGLCSRSGKG